MTYAPAPMSLRAYARRRGVSPEAVSKAIHAGRLRESVVVVGDAPKIADPDLADREWRENTAPRLDDDTSAEPLDEEPSGVPSYNVSRARREAAAARREVALADMAEIERDEKIGELVPVADARADVIAKFTVVKTRILGVPSRLAQRLPGLNADVVPTVERLLREALEELAVEVDEVDDDDE